jgi:hypothetical protein
VHVKDGRYCSMADVDIDFQFATTDRVLIASKPKRHQSGKAKKQAAPPRVAQSEAQWAGLPF